MSDSGLPPAGWYDDPENPGQHRYWDGQQWTDQRRPAPGAATPPAPPSSGGSQWPSSTGGYGGQPSYGSAPTGEKPDPWLWQSIAVTLLCCLPLGVVGIIFAAQSQSAWKSGNAVEAKDKADKAKLFTLIGLGAGLLIGIAVAVTGIG